jgi:hypothetical protein
MLAIPESYFWYTSIIPEVGGIVKGCAAHFQDGWLSRRQGMGRVERGRRSADPFHHPGPAAAAVAQTCGQGAIGGLTLCLIRAPVSHRRQGPKPGTTDPASAERGRDASAPSWGVSSNLRSDTAVCGGRRRCQRCQHDQNHERRPEGCSQRDIHDLERDGGRADKHERSNQNLCQK